MPPLTQVSENITISLTRDRKSADWLKTIQPKVKLSSSTYFYASFSRFKKWGQREANNSAI